MMKFRKAAAVFTASASLAVASSPAMATAIAAVSVDDVTTTITNNIPMITSVGISMMAVNILVRLLSKPKRAG